ncbi:LytTR family transcriptional regulator [Spirosoma sp. HMF4905]|uniref:LytTR family transcriptional regulator n=1 Tax=Spirosoma arboris TaxID=2682092 RepID=A0A7K1SL82_9BACT|nr:LytTR family DNA-binding domain-containing protein [Spirosoma arboris]MVM34570.1 LytTR family transcriptional regulator [Spirosoma arboris]
MRKNNLHTNQILYIIGAGNYSIVHQVGGRHLLMSHTLKWYQGKYPDFIRINKGALINPTYVVSWQKTSRLLASLTMQNGQQLVIARRRMLNVLEQVEQTLFLVGKQVNGLGNNA